MNSAHQILSTFRPRVGFVMYRQISDFVRDLIRNGQLAENFRMPGQRELSELWSADQYTVNKALNLLVKEGLLQKSQGVGTFVRPKEQKISRVGIYLARPYSLDKLDYYSHLLFMLKTILDHRKIGCSFFYDPRPEFEQKPEVPSDLAAAIKNHEIDGLIGVKINDITGEWIHDLKIPVVVGNNRLRPHVVANDFNTVCANILQWAHDNHIRSLGCITPSLIEPWREEKNLSVSLLDALRKSNLEFRDEWFITPEHYIYDDTGEEFAKSAALQFFELDRLPEALLIYPDIVAQVALQNIPKEKIPPPEKFKLLLHRNRELPYHSWYPCSWLEFSIQEFAQALIDSLLNYQNEAADQPRMVNLKVVAN